MNNIVFKIDGVAIPTPSEYGFDIEDLSSEQSGRTLDGVMHKDVVSVKDYYTCMWKHMSWENASALLALVDGKTQVSLTYVDPRNPTSMLTNNFYIGKRSGKANNLNHPTNTWRDVTFQFIRI